MDNESTMTSYSLRAQAYIAATIVFSAGLCLAQIPDWGGPRAWLLLLVTILALLAQIFQVGGLIAGSFYNASVVAYSFALFAFGRPEALWIAALSNIFAWLRGRKYIPWYAQAFNIGTLVIPLSAADLAYKLVTANQDLHSLLSVLGILVAGMIFISLNHFMVGTVHWLVDGKSFTASGMFGRVLFIADITLFAMGGASALIWVVNPFLAILIVSPLYLIYLTLQLPALLRRAESDAKTGLFNANYFKQALEKELARAERFKRPLSVVMADLDYLRNINNTYGHLAGDVVLTGIATLLRQAVRDYDSVARFGGEEFAIMLLEATPEDVRPRVESIRATIEAAEFRVSTSPTPVKVTMSFGLAGRLRPGQSAEEILQNADKALYQAKQTGRNRVCLFAETEQSSPANTARSQSASECESMRDNSPLLRHDASDLGQRAMERRQQGTVITNSIVNELSRSNGLFT